MKLAKPAVKGATTLTLSEPVADWRVGDRVIVTATWRLSPRDDSQIESVSTQTETEQRIIKGIDKDGLEVVLDAPLTFRHAAFENRRGEVANLSRNAIIESADPDGARAHDVPPRFGRIDLLRRISPSGQTRKAG